MSDIPAQPDTVNGALYAHRNLRMMVVADLALFAAAYVSAYLLRFDGDIPARHIEVLHETLVPMLLCKLAVAHFFGLYRGMWRYTSLVDLINVFKAVALSSLLIFSAMLFNRSVTGFSRGVLLLDALLTLTPHTHRVIFRVAHAKHPTIPEACTHAAPHLIAKRLERKMPVGLRERAHQRPRRSLIGNRGAKPRDGFLKPPFQNILVAVVRNRARCRPRGRLLEMESMRRVEKQARAHAFVKIRRGVSEPLKLLARLAQHVRGHSRTQDFERSVPNGGVVAKDGVDEWIHSARGSKRVWAVNSTSVRNASSRSTPAMASASCVCSKPNLRPISYRLPATSSARYCSRRASS